MRRIVIFAAFRCLWRVTPRSRIIASAKHQTSSLNSEIAEAKDPLAD